jgi:hypothetical protein
VHRCLLLSYVLLRLPDLVSACRACAAVVAGSYNQLSHSGGSEDTVGYLILEDNVSADVPPHELESCPNGFVCCCCCHAEAPVVFPNIVEMNKTRCGDRTLVIERVNVT